MYVFTITVEAMYYFQSAMDWNLEVWIHKKHVSVRTDVLGFLPYMVELST